MCDVVVRLWSSTADMLFRRSSVITYAKDMDGIIRGVHCSHHHMTSGTTIMPSQIRGLQLCGWSQLAEEPISRGQQNGGQTYVDEVGVFLLRGRRSWGT